MLYILFVETTADIFAINGLNQMFYGGIWRINPMQMISTPNATSTIVCVKFQ